jgi:hypothetical protein
VFAVAILGAFGGRQSDLLARRSGRLCRTRSAEGTPLRPSPRPPLTEFYARGAGAAGEPSSASQSRRALSQPSTSCSTATSPHASSPLRAGRRMSACGRGSASKTPDREREGGEMAAIMETIEIDRRPEDVRLRDQLRVLPRVAGRRSRHTAPRRCVRHPRFARARHPAHRAAAARADRGTHRTQPAK